jgi:hypothetical protein
MKTIKVISVFLFIAVAFTFSSCKKGDVTKTFDLVISGAQLQVDAQVFDGNEKTFSNKIITSGIEARLNEFGATLDKVDKIELKSAALTITSPSSQTFDGIDYLSSYITAGSLAEAKVAFKVPIDQTGLTTIALDNQYTNLTEYIKSTEFTYTVKGYNSIDIPDMIIAADLTFKITATVPK